METRSDSSPGAGLWALRGAVRGAEARAQAWSQPPTHRRSDARGSGPDQCEASLETAVAHRATASSTVGLQV